MTRREECHAIANSTHIIILLPIYNEALGLAHTLDELHQTLDSHGLRYTIVAVDDGSDDATPVILHTYAARLPLVTITHSLNRGLGETIRDGLERAASLAEELDEEAVIIRMDADHSHDPSSIPQMLARIAEGYDVVVASRFAPGGQERGVPAFRRLLSRTANLMMRLCVPIPGVRDYATGFRAYRASVIRAALYFYRNDFIELKGWGFTSTVEKLLKLQRLGARMTEIPIVLRYDRKRSSSKMSIAATILGYGILLLKHIFWFGGATTRWAERVAELKHDGTWSHRAQGYEAWISRRESPQRPVHMKR